MDFILQVAIAALTKFLDDCLAHPYTKEMFFIFG